MKEVVVQLNSRAGVWERFFASDPEPEDRKVYELWVNSFELGRVQDAVRATNTEVCAEPVLPGHNITATWFEYVRKYMKCGN